MISLAGRRIVVVGAGGGGIGTTICHMIEEAGGEVVGVDIDPTQGWLVADAADEDSLEAVVPDEIDGLVHVVGGFPASLMSRVVETTPDRWDDVLRHNLTTAGVATRVVARRMVEGKRPGSIVLLASIAGITGMPFGAGYAAAKAGVIAFSRSAAVELGPHGIRVNVLAVGSVRVPANRSGGLPHDTPEQQAVLPLRRRGRPDDIAGAALFLLSDLAAFITGAVLPVDGGSSARAPFLDADSLPVFVPEGDVRDRLTDRST